MRYKMTVTKRKIKRGISDAVISLILIIASTIIALIIIGFTFGLFGSLGGTATVYQVGTAVIYGPVNGNYKVVVTLHSTGDVSIISAMFTGIGTGAATESLSLTPGTNVVTLSIPTTDVSTNLLEGQTYTLTLSLSSGETVVISALYEG